MKKLIDELKMTGLTGKQKAVAWYFLISFCLAGCISDESALWAIAFVVLNLAVAALLVKSYLFTKSNENV